MDATWHQRCSDLDDKWYERFQKMVADHSTKMQQKISENATLIVQFHLFIFIFISNVYIEHAPKGKNGKDETSWKLQYPWCYW